MLIGYSMPAVNAVSLGAGSAWLTADNGAALFDGKPARATRIQRTSGSPTINVTLTSAIVVRIVALLGLNLPEGVAVTAAGGNGITRRLADGTVACWIVAPIATAAAAVNVVLTTTQATIQVGELVIMPAIEIAHQSDWSIERIDPSQTELNVGSQPGTNSRQPYRRLSANFTPDGIANVRGGGLANGMDWERLGAAVTMDRRCVAVARWKGDAGAVDPVELARTAIYGIGRIAAIQHQGGNYYASAITVNEVPAIA